MTRASVDRIDGAGKLWGAILISAFGAIGGAAPADAAMRYWSPGGERASARIEPSTTYQRPLANRHEPRRVGAADKPQAKPQGPLVVAISIDHQTLRLYDANGEFAQSPVSTGMKGHPTPMGVFSVIQKQKLHLSNIYSNAPMPYMQRITWSGVAIHAGVLPGYPASHGCIRMPMAFAIKMWNWTKMGARVVVTPGEIAPESVSHPLLATQRMPPQPMAAAEPALVIATAAKSDKAVGASPLATLASSDPGLALRTTIGRGKEPSSASAPPALTAQTDFARSVAEATISLMTDDAVAADAKVQAGKPNLEAIAAKPSETATDRPLARSAAAGTLHESTSEAAAGGGNDNTKSGGVDPRKDQARWPDTDKPSVAKPVTTMLASLKRNAQISVFISRKDAKLYVRQNFAPLFEWPITIAPSDRPLGTHVFTAQVDKVDATQLHWSVVSLPEPAHGRQGDAADSRGRRRHMIAAETKPVPLPDNPTEALDRLSVPADIMAGITEALTSGSSIIVSDQGINAGETGEGTDFIVSLR